MSVRLQVAAVIYMMVQAVLFGVGAVTVLVTPLSAYAAVLIPAVVVATAMISIPASWIIAPHLMLARERRRSGAKGGSRAVAGRRAF